VGDSHALAVQVTEGGIPTTYQWKFNNGSMVVDGPTAAQWPLTNTTMAAAGDYWCEVTFDGITHASDTVTIEVRPRISITTPPVGGSAAAGGSYTFIVAASGGYGTLSYQWKKDGENILGADSLQYVCSGLAADDSGEYTVEISDTNGETIESLPVTLTVATGLPAAGLGGLALLVAAMAVAGARRKRQ
jgi:hypothetical protein